MFQVQMKGIEKLHKFAVNLGPELPKEIKKQGETFMRNTQKSAKLRAPRFTGKLAESIKLMKRRNQLNLVVDSPYGYFQEFGFRPHYVQLFRSTRVGGTVADWVAGKGISDWMGSIFVSKFKPFLTPALEINIAKLPMMLSHGTKKVIKREVK